MTHYYHLTGPWGQIERGLLLPLVVGKNYWEDVFKNTKVKTLEKVIKFTVAFFLSVIAVPATMVALLLNRIKRKAISAEIYEKEKAEWMKRLMGHPNLILPFLIGADILAQNCPYKKILVVRWNQEESNLGVLQAFDNPYGKMSALAVKECGRGEFLIVYFPANRQMGLDMQERQRQHRKSEAAELTVDNPIPKARPGSTDEEFSLSLKRSLLRNNRFFIEKADCIHLLWLDLMPQRLDSQGMRLREVLTAPQA